MRYTGLLLGSILSVLALAQPALAQEEYLPKQGDVRVGVSGALDMGAGASYLNIDDFKTTSIGVGIDYFLTEAFSVNLGFLWSESDSGDQKEKITAYGFGIGYYFANPSSTSNVVPFLRVNYVGLDLGDLGLGKPSGFAVSGGAHIFIGPNASWDITLSYVSVRASGATRNGFTGGIGLSVWFR